MTMRIKWKRPNDIGQTMSQCGRYWFSRPAGTGFVRIWHEDTWTIVGHFETVTEAKAAAQEHFETMRRDMVLTNR